jgi:hypothetical protein
MTCSAQLDPKAANVQAVKPSFWLKVFGSVEMRLAAVERGVAVWPKVTKEAVACDPPAVAALLLGEIPRTG